MKKDMSIRRIAAAAAVIIAIFGTESGICRAQELLKPDETFMFAERDST